MACDREAIFVELFRRIEAIADFKFTSRVFQSWDDTPPKLHPACFLSKGPETHGVILKGLPADLRLMAKLVMYARNTGDRTTPPSTQLNQLITAVSAALERKPLDGPVSGARFPNAASGGSFGTTLGGLCVSCQISGTVDVFEGLLGGDAVAILPIEILTTE